MTPVAGRQHLMLSEELNFELPAELIAQEPAAKRAESRLLHYVRDGRTIAHRRFADLPRLLRAGDLLVFNDTRVLPARFILRKTTGGRIEALFLRQEHPKRWQVLLKGMESYRGELNFEADQSLSAVSVQEGPGGWHEIELSRDEKAAELLERIGRMPLPPYIKRDKVADARDAVDRERYQTVYAKLAGSVAAPTAGLHFTPELLAELDGAGVRRTSITLNVGLGTFKPVTAESLGEHVMHSESYEIGEAAAHELNLAMAQNRRIVAVGTTAARVLESHSLNASWKPTRAETSIFIYPPYRWKHVGAMITNFHLPRSTLIALVAALVGLDEQRRVYAEAIAQRYRFFSYGDAMFVE
jgi:S-adenosylmethionine:tRNA ribosyltransferase-isomerase